MIIMGNKCIVCNYAGLFDPPYDERGIPSDEICPCCGFHYGYDDDDVANKEDAFKLWKEKWIENGLKWFSKGRKSPEDWKANEQLKGI